MLCEKFKHTIEYVKSGLNKDADLLSRINHVEEKGNTISEIEDTISGFTRAKIKITDCKTKKTRIGKLHRSYTTISDTLEFRNPMNVYEMFLNREV